MDTRTRVTRHRSRRWLSALAVGLSLAVASTATAAAAKPNVAYRNFEFAFLDGIDTESCPGLTIEVDLTGVRNWIEYYNGDGDLVKEIINVRYWFTFTNVADRSLVVKSPGHRHITFDYVNDIYTDSGIYRNGTARGYGNVLQVAGRVVETLESAEFISATPKRHEVLGEFCEALAGA